MFANTARRMILGRIVTALALTALWVAPAGAQRVEQSKIAMGIGPDWGTAGHAVIALKKGFFAAEGLEVELKKFSAGLVQLEALAAGNLHFAVPAQAPVFSLRSAGIPILLLANTAIYAEAMALVVRPEANIHKPSDLVGKKIGIFKGSGAELMYRAILAKYGIDPKSVDAVGLQPPEQLSSMISGAVDGIIVWEPWVMQTMDKARGVVVHSGGISQFEGSKGTRAVVDWTRGVLTTTETMVRRNPRTTDAVMRAFLKAQQFLTDPSKKDEAIRIFSAYQEQDVAFNQRQFPAFEFSLALDQGFLDGMNKPLDFLESIGRVKKRVDPLDYTYAEPLRKLSPESVTIPARYKP